MNLFYTSTAYPPSVGGAQLHLHELVKHMQMLGEQVGVAYQWDTQRTDWLSGTTWAAPAAGQPTLYEGIPVQRIAPTEFISRTMASLYYVWQGQALHRVARSLLPALKDTAHLLFQEKPDIIHNNRIGREGLALASLQLARSLNIPFVFTPNHHHHWQGWWYRHYWRIYREADAIIARTQIERRILIQGGVQPSRIHVIGIGSILSAQPDGQRFRQRYDLPPDVPIVLFLGQKFTYKRFDRLLAAAPAVWRHHPETVFVFIGPRTDYSRRCFKDLHDSRILELDTVTLQDKTDALAACDVLCVPSRYESFGGVYLEAGALHKPVIAGDAPAVRELLAHGHNGFLSHGDPQQIASWLICLLSNQSLRQQIGENLAQMARCYDWHMIANQTHRVYKALKKGFGEYEAH